MEQQTPFIPNDILRVIISFLKEGEGDNSIFNSLVVCKKWNHIAKPLFKPTKYDTEKAVRIRDLNKFKSIVTFPGADVPYYLKYLSLYYSPFKSNPDHDDDFIDTVNLEEFVKVVVDNIKETSDGIDLYYFDINANTEEIDTDNTYGFNYGLTARLFPEVITKNFEVMYTIYNNRKIIKSTTTTYDRIMEVGMKTGNLGLILVGLKNRSPVKIRLNANANPTRIITFVSKYFERQRQQRKYDHIAKEVILLLYSKFIIKELNNHCRYENDFYRYCIEYGWIDIARVLEKHTGGYTVPSCKYENREYTDYLVTRVFTASIKLSNYDVSNLLLSNEYTASKLIMINFDIVNSIMMMLLERVHRSKNRDTIDSIDPFQSYHLDKIPEFYESLNACHMQNIIDSEDSEVLLLFCNSENFKSRRPDLYQILLPCYITNNNFGQQTGIKKRKLNQSDSDTFN